MRPAADKASRDGLRVYLARSCRALGMEAPPAPGSLCPCCALLTKLLLTPSLKPQAAADVPCRTVRPFLCSYLPFGHLQTSPALPTIPGYGFLCLINLILRLICFRDLAQILLNASTP